MGPRDEDVEVPLYEPRKRRLSGQAELAICFGFVAAAWCLTIILGVR